MNELPAYNIYAVLPAIHEIKHNSFDFISLLCCCSWILNATALRKWAKLNVKLHKKSKCSKCSIQNCEEALRNARAEINLIVFNHKNNLFNWNRMLKIPKGFIVKSIPTLFVCTLLIKLEGNTFFSVEWRWSQLLRSKFTAMSEEGIY